MSDLFKSIKKNIVPLQNIIREKTNMFIETFNDNFSDSEQDESYSDDFDTESDGEISMPPKQQIFYVDIINNTYSPINVENIQSLEKEKKEEKEEMTCDEISNSSNETVKYELIDDDKLCKNLLVLTKINVNQKLYINYLDDNTRLNFEILLDESYFPQFSRWYYNQNRINSIDSIEKIIDLTLEQFNFYKEKSVIEQTEKYKNLLIHVILGLNNLKITYDTDKESVFNLTKIINKINDNL